MGIAMMPAGMLGAGWLPERVGMIGGAAAWLLLGAVVDITLQPSALRVLGVHHPPTRGAQLPRTRGQVDQPALQLGAQAGTAVGAHPQIGQVQLAALAGCTGQRATGPGH